MADDHPLILFAVTEALKIAPPLKVVAAVRSGKELLATLETQPCELVVTDFSMQPTQADDDGLPLIQRLRHLHPDLPVVVFTMLTNGSILHRITQMGVAGIASKQDSVTTLVNICADALTGKRTVLSLEVTKRLTRANITADAFHSRQPLSPHEFEVARLYGLGISVTEIAQRLNRSVTTVATQKRAAMRKLHIETNADLVRFVTDVMLSRASDISQPMEAEMA
ncbi:response regulator transcription factor [Paraburkholderia ultramafica]|uniref:response regulator transcription factor n=1 Tax=Paraburkholderia ultramafica TaxID=1544867 RepID=UPI001FEA11BF|nr:response regulator transcription factor [Paraburkholderia ultramafica]